MIYPWKTALVTGASSGIGTAIAHDLAAAGVNVVLSATNESKLTEIANSLAAEHSVDTEVLVANLATESGVSAVVARLEQSDKPIDLLVNNAGLGFTGNFADVEMAKHILTLEVNIDALVQLTHAGVNAMRTRGSGTVLNVSSIAGDLPGPKSAVYNATKSFVTSFSESVHMEAKADGVVVSCLCPGLTRTEFQERAGYDASDIPDRMWQSPAAVAAVGLEAAAGGKVVAISGGINKTWSSAMRKLPRPIRRKAADLVNRK